MLPPDYQRAPPVFDTDNLAPERSRKARGGPRLLRWIPLLLALTAIGAFGGIVVYAYFLVDRKATDTVTPLIKAEPRPIKVRPDSPGGMEVPHQDKEIYNRIGSGGDPGSAGGRVERLLPPPESPMPRPPSAPPMLEPPIPPSPDLEPPAGAVVVTLPPPGTAPRPGGSGGPRPTSPPKPAPAQGSPTTSAPPAPARGAAAFRIQLASVQTAEAATGEWARLQRAHADLLASLSSSVSRLDRGEGNAPLFRLQAGPLPDAAAAGDLCSKLKARNVSCIVVRPQ